MKTSKLTDYVNGWFIGDFSPAMWRTTDFEICLKSLAAGDLEPPAIQIIATEITVVIEGRVRINGEVFGPNSVVLIEPGEPADLEVIEDARLLGIKFPSLPKDKVLVS